MTQNGLSVEQAIGSEMYQCPSTPFSIEPRRSYAISLNNKTLRYNGVINNNNYEGSS